MHARRLAGTLAVLVALPFLAAPEGVVPTPVVSGFSPHFGTWEGGEVVTVTFRDMPAAPDAVYFEYPRAVQYGFPSLVAAEILSCSPTECTVVAPHVPRLAQENLEAYDDYFSEWWWHIEPYQVGTVVAHAPGAPPDVLALPQGSEHFRILYPCQVDWNDSCYATDGAGDCLVRWVERADCAMCGDVTSPDFHLSTDADEDWVCDDVDVCLGHDDGVDGDGDGVPDGCDACPVDPGNDADGDGACDSDDACPLDPLDDQDGDGACDSVDPCPLDPDDDLDGDGACADVDPCPLDVANDADGDGICGNVDLCFYGDDHVDGDGDGTPDACDVCPRDATNDSDGDGACDSDDACPRDALDDRDGDGACDSVDPCPADPDDDLDLDGVCGDVDPCPFDAENDADGDGICESVDDCPATSDSAQIDTDGDGTGDACEPDGDSDGVIDDADNCPLDANPTQADRDHDGTGDACELDADDDGIADDVDACGDTAPGAVVGADGCSIADACPCGAPWKNHGAYVTCVEKKATALVAERRLSTTAKGAAVSAAATSSCGGKR